jgi:hypothetical protein
MEVSDPVSGVSSAKIYFDAPVALDPDPADDRETVGHHLQFEAAWDVGRPAEIDPGATVAQSAHGTIHH